MDSNLNPFIAPPDAGCDVDLDERFPLDLFEDSGFPEGSIYSEEDLGSAARGSVRGLDVESWLVDVAAYRRLHSTPPQLPDASEFSREALSRRKGMEWLADVEPVMIQPTEAADRTDAQRAQLERFTEHLLAEAVTIPGHFFPRNPDYVPSPALAVDTETTGLDTRLVYDMTGRVDPKSKLVGVTVAPSKMKGYYLPVRHTEEDGVMNWNPQVIADWLGDIVRLFLCAMSNAAYDLEVMALNGVTGFRDFPYVVDVQILDYQHDMNEKRHGLKATSERHLGRKMIEIAELFVGMGGIKKNAHIEFAHLSASQALVYGTSDSMNTMGLLEFFLSQDPSINVFLSQPLPHFIDQRLQHTLRNMVRPGMPVNYEYMRYAALDAIYRVHVLEQEIYRAAGREFNIGSQPQLNDVLYRQFGLPPLPDAKPSAKGLYSTNEETLDKLLELHPDFLILNYIVRFRKLRNCISKFYLNALANSYVDAFLPYTRVRLSFNQTSADTGRLSASSGDGKERVTVKRKKKLIYKYEKGAWESGIPSQGIPSDPFRTAKARRLKALPAAAGLDVQQPYPAHIEQAFLEELAGL